MSSASENESVYAGNDSSASGDKNSDHHASEAEEDEDAGGYARPPRKRRRNEPNPLEKDWNKTFTPVNTNFLGGDGPKNMPAHINDDSQPLDYLSILCIDVYLTLSIINGILPVVPGWGSIPSLGS